ncbi:C40 family peptidase [Motilimonas pumila]|nr:C40 family peptidase [Motilimonas pumila]
MLKRLLKSGCIVLFASLVSCTSIAKESEQDAMIQYARQYIGVDYLWGGASPKGFDCSGYIQYVYNKYDINIPRTTRGYTDLYQYSVPLREAQVGDLIVFTGTDAKKRVPGHAGIISHIEEGKLLFLHSSSSKKHYGVTETNYYKSGYPKRFLTVIRLPQSSQEA